MDLLPTIGPQATTDCARLPISGRRRLEPATVPGRQLPTTPNSNNHKSCSRWGQMGSEHTEQAAHHAAAAQDRLGTSNFALITRFVATHRPVSFKHVQPLCSQFCSQPGLRLSSGRRWFHELECPVSPGHLKATSCSNFVWVQFRGTSQRATCVANRVYCAVGAPPKDSRARPKAAQQGCCAPPRTRERMPYERAQRSTYYAEASTRAADHSARSAPFLFP
jgi:hypothetical protein